MSASHGMQIELRKLIICCLWRGKQSSVLKLVVTADHRHFIAQTVGSGISMDSITEMSNTERLPWYMVTLQSFSSINSGLYSLM